MVGCAVFAAAQGAAWPQALALLAAAAEKGWSGDRTAETSAVSRAGAMGLMAG